MIRNASANRGFALPGHVLNVDFLDAPTDPLTVDNVTQMYTPVKERFAPYTFQMATNDETGITGLYNSSFPSTLTCWVVTERVSPTFIERRIIVPTKEAGTASTIMTIPSVTIPIYVAYKYPVGWTAAKDGTTACVPGEPYGTTGTVQPIVSCMGTGPALDTGIPGIGLLAGGNVTVDLICTEKWMCFKIAGTGSIYTFSGNIILTGYFTS